MERLEELKKSLESMTYEERLTKLREIREDRKISKHAVTVRKKREQDKGAKLKSAIADMTPEEKAQFLEMLNASQAG
jgi:ABC-type phosphate/phosphonate transport system substrate-binding protein